MRTADDDYQVSAATNEVAAFVIEALRNSSLTNEVRGKHVWVCCPWHNGGNETTPSRRINLSNPRYPPGESFCFGCTSGKTRTWNELAEARHLPLLDAGKGSREEGWLSIPSEEEFYGRALTGDVDHDKVVVYPRPDGPWRGIKASLMRKLGARLMQGGDGVRVFLPAYVGGLLVGYVAACPTGEATNKYIISPGTWSQSTLWPTDIAWAMARKCGYIVLVEGQRDALKLIQHGIPAVCIFGTNAWTEEKAKSIRMLGAVPVIAMDADSAGDGARPKIAASLATMNPIHLNFTPGKRKDAGALKRRDIEEMRDMLEEQIAKRRRKR